MAKIKIYFMLVVCLLNLWAAQATFAENLNPKTHFPTHASLSDSLLTVIGSSKYQRSKFYELFWGHHYRNIWTTPVRVPLLDLSREEVGLKPISKGGSFQTLNLRLANPEGKEYVIRSIDKDPSKALPEKLRKTFVADLMRDQTSVIHPYGALIIPVLAEAAGVYHTNPKLVVVPDSPLLGEFRQEFAGMLALLEERPEADQSEVASFGNSGNIISSRKALNKLVSNTCTQIDSRQFLKCRLFDMWVGDWSRREDQWRWATFSQGARTILKPIPRDRDHAFFKFNDGILTWIGSKIKTSYQTFDKRIRQVEGLTQSARPLDTSLLSYLNKEDFKQIADSLQQSLTDEVIVKATHTWPAEIYALSGAEFEAKLKSRRDQLPAIADKFYKILAQQVIIAGTDKAEKFVVERLNKRQTKISVFGLDDNCGAQKIGERIFTTSETKSIQLYGLGGDDIFEIAGDVSRGINIYLYDGAGEDTFRDESAVKSLKRKIWIYDSGDGNNIKAGRRTKVIKHYKPQAEEFNGDGWLLRYRLH